MLSFPSVVHMTQKSFHAYVDTGKVEICAASMLVLIKAKVSVVPQLTHAHAPIKCFGVPLSSDYNVTVFVHTYFPIGSLNNTLEQ